MKEGDSISDYFTKIRSLTNLMKGCGEVMRDQLVVEKVLRTLTPRFDHIVVAIEESKDLEVFKIEELQSSLEAHEQRIKERNQERTSDQALPAQSSRRYPGQGSGHKKVDKAQSRGSWKHDRGKHEASTQKPFGQDQPFRKFKKKVDKRKIQCYNCKNLGHYASECRLKQSLGSENEAGMAHGEDSDNEQVLLMVTTDKESVKSEHWYLDTGCSNHMTGHKDWFVKLDESTKSKVKFADHSAIDAEGIGDISIQRKNGKQAYISNVLYVPKMKSNLLSLGQLLEKDYTMTMKDKNLQDWYPSDLQPSAIEEQNQRRPHRHRQTPPRLSDYEIFPDSEITTEEELVHMALLAEMEPVSFEDTIQHNHWLEAMKEELKSIEKNHTWELTQLPSDKKAITVRWVYKAKVNP
ncbi:PREDICTED: uncharacterized protein LOC109339179 [Lupinus angustifolius]|uniref:uncharacterized protein LOC109339179 n=1 Tax=Lupinus angustifolius TaxID=3871 RepID=UPI00092EFE1A|nr:PREDICTED: uncharacterized protein LOC109339179 [Lupinus angustifolius]